MPYLTGYGNLSQAEYDSIVAARSTEAVLPTASTGQVAQDDGSAGIQNPAVAATSVEVQTDANGRIVADNTTNSQYVATNGTSADTLTLTNSQGTPVTDTNANADSVATPTTSPGVGAGNADAAAPTKNSTAQEIDNVFNTAGPIVPQPNVLDQYASYTYQASFYLMKPEAFQAMVKAKKFNPAGSQLLFQDGGAAVSGRNPYFTNDYYIDKFEISSTISGKGTGTAHNANTIKMTVVEPNGITLIENLDKAVTDYLGTTSQTEKKKNFQSQLYLLVIKFWGYDDSGKLVQAGQSQAGATSGATSAPAIVTKYFPMVLNTIKFKIANKLVEYELEGTAVQYQINTGQLRAVVPYNIELSSTTLSNAFNGAADVTSTTEVTSVTTGNKTTDTYTTTTEKPRDETTSTDGTIPTPTAPPKADAAPTAKLTVRQGIVAAMNKFQQDLVKSEQITYPDVYSVEFVTDAIAQAKIAKVGQADSKDPMPVGGSAKEKLDPAAQTGKDVTTRTLSITAGQPMVQVIDQLLKNSTYIEDQQLVKVLEKNGLQVPNGSPGKNLAWYKISMQATPGKYDPKRNAPAYNIKYIIHPYKINDMVSNYFTSPKYNGVHKQYNYWFTGLNTQILSYEQTYNNLYTQVLSGGPPNPNSATQTDVQMTPATRSGQSGQGANGRSNEPAANAADYLYSPGDNVEATLSIIGDPAWLQQGEITFGVDSKNFNFKGFNADGTINFDAQQILFEVLFNTPSDYNLNTGLMDPNVPASTSNSNSTATANSGSQPGGLRKSFIFLATTVTSEFVKGKFTQTLKGSKINNFGNQASKAGNVARPGGNAATTNTATGTADAVRAPNSATGPNGINSIPTSQPSVTAPGENGTALPPTAGSASRVSADGVPVYSANQVNQNLNTNAALSNPLPATPPTAPTSDGGIQSFVDYTAARAGTGGVQTADQQQQIAAVDAAVNSGGSTNLAPAPAVLPIKNANETYDQYQAKLENGSSQQVNTTPPQKMNKSDQ